MKLDQLKAAPGSKMNPKRKGRGHGSGQGKTAGKGHKGQNARAGGGVRPGFEGGQMPLYRRIPKRGFNNKRFAQVYAEVNIGRLNCFDEGTVITGELLKQKGIIDDVKNGLVVLGNGEINKAVTVRAYKFSKAASAKIEAAGGKAEVV